MADSFSSFSSAAARAFARRVMLGLGVLAIVAIGAPLLTYRSDIQLTRRQLETRISREASVHAEALALHFRILEAELERISKRPEVDVHDATTEPERIVLDIAHHGSSLFAGGVGVIDAQGQPVWTEPADLFSHDDKLADRPWFQRMLASGVPVVSALGPDSEDLAIAVPINRGGTVNGAIVGVIDLPTQELPGASVLSERTELVVFSPSGRVLLPANPPEWVARAGAQAVPSLLTDKDGASMTFGDHSYFAAATRVGHTGLTLMLATDEDEALGPLRTRFLWQLLFTVVLQSLTLALCFVYLRATSRGFVEMEARGAEQARLASLGSASSLIAHEVKNSLNGLVAAASMLETGGNPALPVRSIRSQTDRLKHLATSLLQFGRPEKVQRASVRLDALARDVAGALKILPEAEVVRIDVDAPEPVELTCDPLLLSTAADNLVRNAVEAGAVAKDTGRTAAPSVRVRVEADPQRARLIVEDDAGGPPEGFEDRLFKPFVTSKPKGIGLGLSMARRAVEQQGGTLRFERTATGSRFTIELPINDEVPT